MRRLRAFHRGSAVIIAAFLMLHMEMIRRRHFVRYVWRKAHAEAWKNPPLSILEFRVARAEAAGVTYRE